MKLHPHLHFIWLAILGAILLSSSPAHASGDPWLEQARDLLHAAWNPGGDPPQKTKLVHLLQEAKTLVAIPPRDNEYNKEWSQARTDIADALILVKDGAPEEETTELIREALDKLRDMT